MKYKKLHPGCKIIQPRDGDAGYDLCSNEDITLFSYHYTSEYNRSDVQILYPTIVKIDTGISVEIPKGHVGLVRDRSSMGAKGVIVCGGVIDSQYRGNIIVCLSNIGCRTVEIKKDDKIAQLLIIPCITPELVEVDELEQTERGEGGFGSTGK